MLAAEALSGPATRRRSFTVTELLTGLLFIRRRREKEDGRVGKGEGRGEVDGTRSTLDAPASTLPLFSYLSQIAAVFLMNNTHNYVPDRKL